MTDAIRIAEVPAAATRPLRQAVLRPHQPPLELVYPGDDEPGSFHLAAYRGETLIGVISLSVEAREGAPPAARPYRLRGMATVPDARGQGVAAQLLAEATQRITGAGADSVWCNARTSAAGFYARFGFERVGDEFELPGIGPHYVMQKPLGSRIVR